ncbi:MAG: hypothetical protein A2087_06375 [Spirochaetes bacterium GWD1_61_31]|nr:MAG: hypothetical protein A2Y37_09095 [Spirochaetes bacterium GWB1_60_80]OHD29157.1 MAG: hypothetical protein A2004_14695 [Spirochaetes bacterium GWC1_61_12]OHD39978.1 MAG: hypothetical protein A2087_06375 [Spirochaetes bacterium GWD1_61_31]OHD42368.1 MAG: hypothetical protein A2Y35_11625 [Spirochaetes bacterium GWE1_60_18]OHD60540.1 MAG: hypothetical protein A2Y32_03840 [Spirochaetes bacterium GWF1_60_12]HAW85562.1 dentilisin complex serine proteinase subunit PrtP [Spirochaetaceae bacteriu
MRKFFAVLAAALLLASCGSPYLNTPVTGPAQVAGLTVVPVTTDSDLLANLAVNYGYVIVKVASGFDTTNFTKLGADVASSMVINGNQYYRLHKAEGVTKLVNSLRLTRGVYYADPELLSKRILPITADNTSRALGDGNLALDPSSAYGDYALEITGALAAYADPTIGYGTNQVVVAVIDTGINMAHRDFWDDKGTPDTADDTSIVIYAKSAFNKAVDGTMTYVGADVPFVTIPAGENWDDEAHGTHVSGTIAARGDNNIGVAGVAWKNTKIISYKCFAEAEEGSGADWSIYGALSDLTAYIIDQRTNHGFTQATVPVNMSLGGDFAGNFEYEMINYALANGVLPVVAMGNDGMYQGQFPASYQGVLAVGATNGKDEKVHFSNSGHWISVSAPGFDILSTGNGGTMWNVVDDYRTTETQWMSGTSMATPFVTGVIGYLLSFNNTLTPYQIKTILENTAADKGAVGFDTDYGWGRVDVLAAADLVKNGVIPAAGSTYTEAKVVATVANTHASYTSPIASTDWVVDQMVSVYNASNQFVCLGKTNDTDGQVEFRGLMPGNYTLKTNYMDTVQSVAVTLAAADETAAFSFNIEIPVYTFISTAANGAYSSGGADPVIDLYQADGTTQIAHLDDIVFDTLQLSISELPPGNYLLKVTYYQSDIGEYGLHIGSDAVTAINVVDGARAGGEADSQEPNETSAAAKALSWNTSYGFSFHVLGDIDWFSFTVPTP